MNHLSTKWADQPKAMLAKKIEKAHLDASAFQLDTFLKRHGYTHAELAFMLQVDERTVRRWVSGETLLPRVVIYALLWLQSK